LINRQRTDRSRPLAFQFGSQATLSDNRFKLVHNTKPGRLRSDNGDAPVFEWELYDLLNDPAETTNIADQHPQVIKEMQTQLAQWQASCRASNVGQDYAE
ncbi:MAG: hypothetical protein AAF961_03800, partial [Planctomycetota bacterium]